MVLSLCKQLDREQKNNNGNIPRGLISKMVLDANSAGIKINRHDIANCRRKLDRETRANAVATLEEATPE